MAIEGPERRSRKRRATFAGRGVIG